MSQRDEKSKIFLKNIFITGKLKKNIGAAKLDKNWVSGFYQHKWDKINPYWTKINQSAILRA